MALIKCPSCGQQLSDRATTCPGCGHANQPRAPGGLRTAVAADPGGARAKGSAIRSVVIAVTIFALVGGGFLFATAAGKRFMDSRRIVGKWKKENPLFTELYIEFRANGSFSDDTAFSTLEGTYEILEGNRVSMEQEGQLWGTNDVVLRYEIRGEELLLTPESGSGLAIRTHRVE